MSDTTEDVVAKRLYDMCGGESFGESTSSTTGVLGAVCPLPKRPKIDVELPPRDSPELTACRATLASESGRFIEPLVRRMSDFVRGSDKRYISLVFNCNDEKSATQLCNSLHTNSRGSYQGGLLIIRQHGDHVHVIHLCTYSGSRCRCTFIEKAKSRANLGVPVSKFRRKYASHLDYTDCANILLYFFEECRKGYNYFECSGRVERFILRNQDLEIKGHLLPERRNGKHEMEACLESPEIELLSPEQLGRYFEEIGDPSIPGNSEAPQRKKRDTASKIMAIIKQYPTSPTKNICNHLMWLENESLQFLRQDNRTVQNVIDTFCHLTCKWKLEDFWKMYHVPHCVPSFNCYSGKVFDMYYSLTRSVEILEELLLFQCGTPNEVYSFLLNLYDIVERKKPKCNSILIFSPPSAGKNFFFDTLLCFCLNKGQLGNPNKHNNFAYQELYGKRIVLWNEPYYENAAIDTLKMVLGGDDITVNVKCKPDMSVEKTPIIILTNRYISLMTMPAFADRIYQCTWKAAPYLKDYNLKPYPLAIYSLFMKYGIIK